MSCATDTEAVSSAHRCCCRRRMTAVPEQQLFSRCCSKCRWRHAAACSCTSRQRVWCDVLGSYEGCQRRYCRRLTNSCYTALQGGSLQLQRQVISAVAAAGSMLCMRLHNLRRLRPHAVQIASADQKQTGLKTLELSLCLSHCMLPQAWQATQMLLFAAVQQVQHVPAVTRNGTVTCCLPIEAMHARCSLHSAATRFLKAGDITGMKAADDAAYAIKQVKQCVVASEHQQGWRARTLPVSRHQQQRNNIEGWFHTSASWRTMHVQIRCCVHSHATVLVAKFVGNAEVSCIDLTICGLMSIVVVSALQHTVNGRGKSHTSSPVCLSS
jgi:hypothetical protein